MTRKLTACPARPGNVSAHAGFEHRELTVNVVTPMFGGGVEPGKPDPVTLIRPTAIRGHLRFWWRATRGAAFADARALKQREVEIFGDTTNPSPLVVEVDVPKWEGRRECARDYGFDRFGPEAYALFSAKQNENDLVQEGFSFRLRVCWPKHTELQRLRDAENEQRRRKNENLLPEKVEDITRDVELALAAWLNFGGLGARTRRGCGAVHCTNPDPIPSLQEAAPKVSGLRVFVGPAAASELDAWAKAVDVYRQFRQKQRGTKTRNGRTVYEGRSFWPEPDAIRKLSGCTKPSHAQPVVQSNQTDLFPRAELGMPIIFWFKDGPGKDHRKRPNPPDKDKDPCDAELVPQILDSDGEWITGTRLASPIITRPVMIDQRWRPAIIVLPQNCSHELRGVLKTNGLRDGDRMAVEQAISESQIRGSRVVSLRTMQGRTSAIEGLIAFAQQAPYRFTEVKP